MQPELVTTADRPDLAEQAKAALLPGWAEFILHDQVSEGLIGRAARYFPQFDVRLLAGGVVIAGAWAVALRWDGTAGHLPDGYDGALTSAVAEHERDLAPDTLCAMAAAVHPDWQGSGLGGELLTALRARGAAAGLTQMIAPVRPVLKCRYPLTPMTSFARWTRGDGTHLDPWVRTHQRLGATILGAAPRSMVVTGTVAEWQ